MTIPSVGSERVYKVTTPDGGSCHFGDHAGALAYARKTGIVECITLTPRDFKIVPSSSAGSEAKEGATNAPKIIYLQDGGGDGDPLPKHLYKEDVTWCSNSIEEDDTKYLRFDLHEAELANVTAQLSAAQRENADLKAWKLEAADEIVRLTRNTLKAEK